MEIYLQPTAASSPQFLIKRVCSRSDYRLKDISCSRITITKSVRQHQHNSRDNANSAIGGCEGQSYISLEYDNE